jgi:4-amino-4-deoxy-L-arabinose transferase-like glycosyltransferase
VKTPISFFSKRKGILFPIFLLALFFIVVLTKTPIKQTFEYNRDEGYNLMKSSLFLKGFSLYKEIWNDQPPLFTVILSYWLKLFGLSVYHGRILVLIFSAILLWAFYQTIKNQWGHFSAFMAVVFLILSNVYTRLSVSVMIGIPSLTFAMLSVYCLTLHRKLYLKYLLVLSGIFMALSLQTKLFTVFLIPFIALEIIQTKGLNLKGEKEQNYPLSPFLLWFGSLLAVFLAITVVFFHFNFPLFIKQLFQPHLRGTTLREFNFSLLWKIILTDYDIALLALTGIILLLRQRKWQFLFPVLWLVSAFVILLNHRPIWDHYYPLISIPICWLAAISFGEFFRIDIRQGWLIKKNKYSLIAVFLRWLTAILIILTILSIPAKYYRVHVLLRGGGKASLEEQAVVDLLMKYKTHTDWVITDRPIFAFYANMLVPPELAIIVRKRNFTDEAAQDYFIDTLQKYKAKLILIYMPEFYGPKVISYIKENYDNLYQREIPERDISWIDRDIKPTK